MAAALVSGLCTALQGGLVPATSDGAHRAREGPAGSHQGREPHASPCVLARASLRRLRRTKPRRARLRSPARQAVEHHLHGERGISVVDDRNRDREVSGTLRELPSDQDGTWTWLLRPQSQRQALRGARRISRR